MSNFTKWFHFIPTFESFKRSRVRASRQRERFELPSNQYQLIASFCLTIERVMITVNRGKPSSAQHRFLSLGHQAAALILLVPGEPWSPHRVVSWSDPMVSAGHLVTCGKTSARAPTLATPLYKKWPPLIYIVLVYWLLGYFSFHTASVSKFLFSIDYVNIFQTRNNDSLYWGQAPPSFTFCFLLHASTTILSPCKFNEAPIWAFPANLS